MGRTAGIRNYDYRELSQWVKEHGVDSAMQHFKCSRITIRLACATHGVEIATPRKANRKLYADLVRAGQSPKAVAAAFGCSPDSVRVACRLHGVDLKAHRQGRYKLIAEFIAAGNSLQDAMAKFNCKRHAVIKACCAENVALPKDMQPLYKTRSFEVLRLLLQAPELNEAAVAAKLKVTRERVRQVREAAIASKLLGPGSIILAINPAADLS